MRDVATYYHDGPSNPPLQQGDLILAPVARLEREDVISDAWSDIAPATYAIPATDDLTGYLVRTGHSIAMVTTHDCHMDRAFLNRYQALRKRGKNKTEAATEAESDPALDRFISVAPLVPIESFQAQPDAIRRHEVIGLFPVPARTEVGIFEGAVDLTQRTSLDRFLIIDRLAVLTEPTRTLMRYALARADALRTPQIGFELEEAIGKRIVDVRRSDIGPGLVVFELGDGTELELLLRPATPATGGPSRTAAPQRDR